MKQQTSATTETQFKGRNIIDFTGKTLYVGIDVHQKDYQVAVVHEGICLGNHRMAASGEKLMDHLHKRYPGATFRCVYESSALGFTLQRQLSGAGLECIVVHAADVSTNDKERRRKTDPVDALKLAREHESHHLEAIHVPEEDIQKQRNLIRFRKKMVNDLTRSKNRLKSLLKYQGIVRWQSTCSWPPYFITLRLCRSIQFWRRLLFNLATIFFSNTRSASSIMPAMDFRIILYPV